MPAFIKKPKSSCVGPECEGCSSPDCYAEGGSVLDSSHRRDNEKGVHRENVVSQPEGVSSAGAHLRVSNRAEGESDRDDFKRQSIRKHKQVLGEMRSMPKPKLYAEGGLVSMADGGEIEDGEEQMNSEIHHTIGSELMDALERKDHKGIMSALNAAIMECMNGEYK